MGSCLLLLLLGAGGIRNWELQVASWEHLVAQKKFDQRYIQILSLALGSMFKAFRPINLQIMTAADEGRW
jgi:hypothetical protein